MKRKNMTAALCGIVITAAFFSCKKNETAPAPTPLSASEAKTSLSASNYQSDSIAVAEISNSPSIQAANTLSNLGGGGFSVNVTSLSLRQSAVESSAYTTFFNQLFDLGNITVGGEKGARIPKSATGTYEFYVITGTGYYKSYDFKKTSESPSNGLTIKYPSKYDYYNSTVTSVINNAEYTVSNITLSYPTSKYCDYNYNSGTTVKTVKTKTDTVPSSFKASLKIDGVSVMSVDYSVTYGTGSKPSAASYNATIGDYSITYTAAISSSSANVNALWKKNNEVINGLVYDIVGNIYTEQADPCNVSYSGNNFESFHYKLIRKEVSLDYNLDFKNLMKEISNNTATSTQQVVDIYNKYFKLVLLKTATGQKIADVVIEYDGNTSGKNPYVLKVKYSDGTTELASKAYKWFKNDNFEGLLSPQF